VFEVRKKVDELWLHLEIMKKKGMKILHFLSSLHGSRHSSKQASSAPATSVVVLVPALQMSIVENEKIGSALSLQEPSMDNVACKMSTS